ncbi:TROVE domain-containing protein, partial [Nitrolancea hollandica]|uniref:TROVE domain-containing protein n=1 Tax=Nitrolancea hollandica TaxID=1206749 RepID=UPI00058D57BE
MRFNQIYVPQTGTVNLAGGEAFAQSPELELTSLVLTSFLNDKYYESGSDQLDRLVHLVSVLDPIFSAKAALLARRRFGMRSVSHVIAAELAYRAKGQTWTKRFFDQIVYRPDDMMEILAYYLAKYGKPVPNAMKKGFAQALTRFDAYQLAKYRGEGKAIALVDVVNLVHPRHTDPIGDLVNGTLTAPDTWEVWLTKAGQEGRTDEEKATFKANAWKYLLENRKLGYFALLRNLRNIAQQAPGSLTLALEQLTDPKAIAKSLVLPFRYSTAIREIQSDRDLSAYAPQITSALVDAMEISLTNVPELPGTSLVALDVSASMRGQPIQIGSLFAAALAKTNDIDLVLFDGRARGTRIEKNFPVWTIARELERQATYGMTDFRPIFTTATKAYDRIIILSDMQAWVGWNHPGQAFRDYKLRTGADPKVYSFDLAGYGTLQFPEANVYTLAGWSEKVFELIPLLEQDRSSLVEA